MRKIVAITTLTLLCAAMAFAQQKGSFTDPRDKKAYKTVKIGNQTWMTENLNYNAKGSLCYGNSEENCKKYGRLYDWVTALNACPKGWHLPRGEEYADLQNYINSAQKCENDCNPVEHLKAKSGWNDDKNGTDTYGFSALPGGIGYGPGDFRESGITSFWWTTDEDELDGPTSYWFGTGSGRYRGFGQNPNKLLSVRCLKGEPAAADKAKADKLAKEKAEIEKEAAKKEAAEKAEVEKTVGKQFNPEIAYGSMTDPRDKTTYKTVNIGGLTWMAENLKYNATGSTCYNGKDYFCKRDGRLYDRPTALKACPDGWHLPVQEEWKLLDKAIGGGGQFSQYEKLKAKSGWESNRNGTDIYGFSVLPTGRGEPSFWNATPTTFDGKEAYTYYGLTGIRGANGGATEQHSVRCIQGKSAEEVFAAIQKAIEDAAGKQFNPKITYGSMTDSRNNVAYKTVKIGNQTWMAENLNYNMDGSKCYSDKEYYCKRDGRLYNRAVALKACPAGWHLPTDEEWSTMDNVVGGAGNAVTGGKLKATRGWLDSTKAKPFNGTDDFGFSAIPIGDDNESSWWTASGASAPARATTYGMHRKIFNSGIYSRSDSPNGSLYSVRCVQGEPAKPAAPAAQPAAQPKPQATSEFCQIPFPKTCVAVPTGTCKTMRGKVVAKCP